MRLVALTAVVMIAFALNSVLNRLALAGDTGTGPAAFAGLRLVSGAAILALLALRRARPPWQPRRVAMTAAALTVYVLGFSFAYVSLDTGVGALILFGGVQVTMFAGAVLTGVNVPLERWIGAGLALAGLAWMLWPEGATAPDPAGAALMTAAAVGWGSYSLLGRGAVDPLVDTARAFLAAAPVGLIALALARDGIDAPGAALAVLSGAVTSGLGYALWYAVLPRLDAAVAALAQLTVPIIALAGGVLLLGEPATLRFAVSAALVLGGVALGVLGPRLRR